MVNSLSSRRVAAMPVAASRVSPIRTRTTPLFSVSRTLPSTVAAGARQALASVTPPGVTSGSQSQVNSGAADFRQLFSSSPIAATLVAADPAPPAPAFVPAFRTAIGSGVDNEGNPVSWNLNSTYFATKDTAQWIANKYGTGKVIEVPFGGSGGPFSASANEYAIQLADGRQVNAGILAGYYARNPEDKFPGLADKLIRGQLGLG